MRQPKSNWVVTDRLYPDGTMISLVQPGPWDEPGEEPVADMIAWVGDTLDHQFEDPADWPELPARIVESFNLPDRAIVNRHVATMTEFSQWLRDVYEKAELAGAYMALTRAKRHKPGQAVSITYGSIQMGSVPPPGPGKAD